MAARTSWPATASWPSGCTTGAASLLFRRSDFDHLRDPSPEEERHLIPGGMTHDGRFIVGWVFGLFGNGYQADNGSFQSGHSSVLLDTADPSKLYYLGPGCSTTTPPTGPFIYHVSREGETFPDIFRLSTADVATRASYQRELGQVDQSWGHEYFPRISTDGRWLVYGASSSCHMWYECDYDIFLHQLGAAPEQRQRLLEHPANDNYPHLYVGPLWQAQAPPHLAALPAALELQAQAGQAPAAATVRIFNQGGGDLVGATVQLEDGGDGGGWLQPSLRTRGAALELELTLDLAGLSAGRYQGSLSVVLAAADNSPLVIPVTLELAAVADGGGRLDGPAPPAPGEPGGCCCQLAGPSCPGSLALLLVLWIWRRLTTVCGSSHTPGQKADS